MDVVALKDRARQSLRSFSPSQLTIIGLLTVAVVIGALAFLHWSSASTYGVLFSDLEAKDASSVVDELKAQGVPYKLAGDGTTVLVPASKVYDLRLSLSAAGLPKSGVVGYELLDKQGLTTSEFSQQVGYQRALEGELTRTLLAMDGMESATVHLAIPRDQLFTDDKQAPRASVLVQTAQPLDDDGVEAIVHLVASSVPGLTAEGVTVADVEGHVLSTDGTSLAGGSSRELRLTRQYEKDLAGDVTALLGQVVGVGRAAVRVSAQLNFDQSQRQTETYDPASAVAVREEQKTENYKGAAGSSPAAGTLGVAGAVAAATGGGSTGSDYQKTETAKEYGVNHVTETSEVAPGKVERLSVAVVLDKAAKPSPDADKVKQVVAAAAGIDAARGDTIVVDTMAFQATAAVTKAAGKAGTGAAAGGGPVELVRTGVGGLILAAVLLVVVASVRRSRSAGEEPVAGDRVAAALAAHVAQARALGGAPAELSPGTAAGPDRAGVAVAALPAPGVSDEVLNLVDQQPDEVAVLLRRWLGDRRA